jgi:hypothetical protein
MNDLLLQLQSLMEVGKNQDTSSSISSSSLSQLTALDDIKKIEVIQSKIMELRELIDQSCDNVTLFIDVLRTSSSNPGSKYYWIVFIVIYGSVYFMS